jgi:hypothetical protein
MEGGCQWEALPAHAPLGFLKTFSPVRLDFQKGLPVFLSLPCSQVCRG